MGKKGDFSLCKKAEVNSLVNAKLFSNREISRKLKVSEASVRRIKKKIEFATTKVIKSQLQDINVKASERTVRRKLKALNFKTCRPTRKSKLIPATKAKRLNWAKHWRDKDVYFWRSNKTQFVRRRDGEKFHSDCVVRTVKHPTKIMIWSVISGKGIGRLDVVKGTGEYFPPLQFTCRNCGGGDRGRVAIYRPFGEVSLSLNRTVTCMVLKANDRRTSCPCHDEFRGPRSDYVRQVALATTTTTTFVSC
ncbi:uncharacterized protein TNCV_3795991 [Trichonephila clavipes]|nr:uncharacterized protein TNCV_3795991 [Trichonephila clavipes]